MLFTSNNCVVYSKDADLIGKLVMHGHKVHYDDNIDSLIQKIRDLHPDLIVLDVLDKIESYKINALIQIHGHIIIRGSVTGDLSPEADENKQVMILPSEASNDEMIEKVMHLNDSTLSKTRDGKPSILIVEDNMDILEMYKVAFQSKGYEVTLASDGLSGMTKAVGLRPDIIILDIMMPHMDGFEVLYTLKHNTSLESVVIVNSNLEGVDEEKKVKELGADYFLRKSHYTPLDVIAFIEEKVLDGKSKTA